MLTSTNERLFVKPVSRNRQGGGYYEEDSVGSLIVAAARRELTIKGKVNPIATFLSAAMMLRWLGEQHDLQTCTEAAEKLEKSINTGFSTKQIKPMEFGGSHGTKSVRDTVLSLINNH